MAEKDLLDRVWKIIERQGVCMLTTRFDGGLRARPLEPRPDRGEGLIWFVTDLRSGKEHEIDAEHDVCLIFTDPDENAYLSITARAEGYRDPSKAAELWDGPASEAVVAYEFAKARLTGAEPNLGENRKVTVNLR